MNNQFIKIVLLTIFLSLSAPDSAAFPLTHPTCGDMQPSDLLCSINTIINENISRLGSDHYMTMMALKFNESKMTIAGKHQDIIIYRAASNNTEIIATDGTWLGITKNI